MITNGAGCRRDVKPRIVMATAAVSKETLFKSKLDWNLREKSNIALYGAGT
jgi:hypothetical protein